MEENIKLPEAKNPLSAEEARRMIALIELDIAKYEVERAKYQGMIAQVDLFVADAKRTIADLNRRVVNVDYPPAPEKKDEAKPEMGEPVKTEESK